MATNEEIITHFLAGTLSKKNLSLGIDGHRLLSRYWHTIIAIRLTDGILMWKLNKNTRKHGLVRTQQSIITKLMNSDREVIFIELGTFNQICDRIKETDSLSTLTAILL